MRHRRHIGGISLQHNAGQRYRRQNRRQLAALESTDTSDAQTEARVLKQLQCFVYASAKAMKHTRKPVFGIVLEDLQQEMLGRTAVNHQRKVVSSGPLDLHSECFCLLGDTRVIPIEVKTHFPYSDKRVRRLEYLLHPTQLVAPIIRQILGVKAEHRIERPWILARERSGLFG